MESLLNIFMLACLVGFFMAMCVLITVGIFIGIELLLGEKNEKS
jgi:hypothetical protein